MPESRGLGDVYKRQHTHTHTHTHTHPLRQTDNGKLIYSGLGQQSKESEKLLVGCFDLQRFLASFVSRPFCVSILTFIRSGRLFDDRTFTLRTKYSYVKHNHHCSEESVRKAVVAKWLSRYFSPSAPPTSPCLTRPLTGVCFVSRGVTVKRESGKRW